MARLRRQENIIYNAYCDASYTIYKNKWLLFWFDRNFLKIFLYILKIMHYIQLNGVQECKFFRKLIIISGVSQARTNIVSNRYFFFHTAWYYVWSLIVNRPYLRKWNENSIQFSGFLLIDMICLFNQIIYKYKVAMNWLETIYGSLSIAIIASYHKNLIHQFLELQKIDLLFVC